MEIEGQRAKRFGGTDRRDEYSKKCFKCGKKVTFLLNATLEREM